MKVTTEQEIEMLLADKPYYSSGSSYCLGKTLTEAGEIVRRIVEDKERQADDRELGMATDGMQKNITPSM